MKDIKIKIKQVRVADFSVRDGSVDIEIFFNDYKTLKHLDSIDDPDDLAHEIVVEIRRKIRDKHQNRYSDDILGNIVNVSIENEDSTLQKMAMFFAKISDKVSAVKNTKTSSNYLGTINNVKSLKLELK